MVDLKQTIQILEFVLPPIEGGEGFPKPLDNQQIGISARAGRLSSTYHVTYVNSKIVR